MNSVFSKNFKFRKANLNISLHLSMNTIVVTLSCYSRAHKEYVYIKHDIFRSDYNKNNLSYTISIMKKKLREFTKVDDSLITDLLL